MLGLSSLMNANLLTSSTASLMGRNFWIFLTKLMCVWSSWFAVGVSQPSGLVRLVNFVSLFLMPMQSTSFSQPGRRRLITPISFARLLTLPFWAVVCLTHFLEIVPFALALRWRRQRLPLVRLARRAFLRSCINFGISLLRVSRCAVKTAVPFALTTATPILVLPGSMPKYRGCTTSLVSYSSWMVNGFALTTRAFCSLSRWRTCPPRVVGIKGLPSLLST